MLCDDKTFAYNLFVIKYKIIVAKFHYIHIKKINKWFYFSL